MYIGHQTIFLKLKEFFENLRFLFINKADEKKRNNLQKPLLFKNEISIASTLSTQNDKIYIEHYLFVQNSKQSARKSSRVFIELLN